MPALNDGRKQTLRIPTNTYQIPTNTFIYPGIPVYTYEYLRIGGRSFKGLSLDYLGMRGLSLLWRRCRSYWLR